MPEGARAAVLLLKLDIISFLNYAWREVHNKMLLRRSIALDCLERTLPPTDQDQKLALLHAPFRGTTLFGGELAKLQEANTKRAATFTVFPQPTAPPTSYSTRPYAGRGKSFRDDKKGFRKPGGRGRGQGRSAPTATVTRPGQSKDSQKTLTVSTDSKKRKSESQEDAPQGLGKPSVIFEGIKTRVINSEGVLPPQVSPVGGRLSNFVEGWKRITNDPYVLSIVAKGYRLCFTSPPLLRQIPWEIRSPQDPREVLGMREQITLMLQKNAGLRRVASSHRSKESERSHSRSSFPYVHDKLCSKLRRKRRLRVQDRSAGCVLSRTDPSKQQEVPQVRLRKQGVPVSSTTFRSKYGPSSFYSFGAHGDSVPAPSGGFGDTISGRLVSLPPGPSNFITTSGSANRYARPGRLHSESKEIRAGPYSGSPVPQNSLASGPRESFTPRVQGWGDSRLRAPSILPQGTRLFSSIPSYGFTQLGLIPLGRLYLRPLQRHFHSLGLTSRFTPPRRSDPVVLANLLRHWLDPHFLTSGIPIRPFQADYTIFTDASSQGWGAHMGDSKVSGFWTRIDRKLHINCRALQHWAPLLQGHQVMIATDNSTVVSYINKQGGTRSPSRCYA